MSTIEIGHYNTGEGIIPEGQLKISPSRFYQFLYNSHTWFRELVLKEEGFQSNSGSNIGNILHYAFECRANDLEPDMEKIEAYIDGLTEFYEEGNYARNVDKNLIRRAYPDMISHTKQYVEENNIVETEGYIWKQLLPGIVIAGSFDALELLPDGTYALTDFKSSADKLPPKRIKAEHKMQASIYAWVLEQTRDIKISKLKIVYVTRFHAGVVSVKTGRTGKSYPSTITPLEHTYDDGSREFIESVIMLCAETVDKFFKEPELAYLLFRDYRLKGMKFDKYIEDYDLGEKDYDF